MKCYRNFNKRLNKMKMKMKMKTKTKTKTMKLYARTGAPTAQIKGTFEMYGSTFCVHRLLLKNNKFSNNVWNVSEYSSGTSIPTRGKLGESATREQAVELAKIYLNNVGAEQYREAFDRFIKEHKALNS